MKRISTGLLAALATLVMTTEAGAQICAGFPTTDRQFSFGGSLGFPEDLDQFGVEASYNASGPLAVFGGLTVTSLEDDVGDGESFDTYRIGAAFDLPAVGQALGPMVSACPVVAFEWTDIEVGSITSIPLGFGLGASIPVGGGGTALMPYAVPQVVFSRFSADSDLIDDVLVEDETETDFALRAGALFTFGQIFAGAEVNRIFEDFGETVFSVRAGLRL